MKKGYNTHLEVVQACQPHFRPGGRGGSVPVAFFVTKLAETTFGSS